METIVICGATGQQGGGVFRSLIKSQKFKIVVLTRDPKSPKALDMQAQGAEIRKADLDNYESLLKAFDGAYGVFAVTQGFSKNYKKFNHSREVNQGKSIIDACIANDVKHVVYSSIFMANGREELNVMDHLTSKFAVEDYIKEKNVPATILRPVAIMDMWGTMPFMPINENSTQGMVGPDVRMPFVHTDDIGALVRIAFENPGEYVGAEMDAVGDFFTGRELAQIIGEIKGVPNYKYKSAPRWLLWVLCRLGIVLDEFYLMNIMYTNWGTPPYPKAIQEGIDQMDEWNPNRVTIKKYIQNYLGIDTKESTKSTEEIAEEVS